MHNNNMAKLTRFGKGESGRITLRFDPTQLAFYGKRAQASGLSTSAFLRECIVQGLIAENVSEIEERLTAFMQKILSTLEQGSGGGFSEAALLSIFTSEEMLAEIVHTRSPQHLYEAQDKAKRRLQKLRSATP